MVKWKIFRVRDWQTYFRRKNDFPLDGYWIFFSGFPLTRQKVCRKVDDSLLIRFAFQKRLKLFHASPCVWKPMSCRARKKSPLKIAFAFDACRYLPRNSRNCLPRKKSSLKKVFLIEKAIKNWFQESTGAENISGRWNSARFAWRGNFSTRFAPFKHGRPRVKKISIKKLISGVFWLAKRTFPMHKDFLHREMNYRAYQKWEKSRKQSQKVYNSIFPRKNFMDS